MSNDIEKFDISNHFEKSILLRKRARVKRDYEAYINQFYIDFEYQISELELQCNQLHDKGEDLITAFIVTGLRSSGYPVTHDGNSNGHVDINLNDPPFTWFGECKLQKGNENTLGGFQQLTTRYSRGNDFGYHGGVIIYHQNTTKKALTSLTEWKSFLTADPEQIGIQCNDIPHRKLYFDSSHEHEDSGYPYLIRHFWIKLTYTPKQ
ncbi:hypothetical protein [Acinetobacter sp. SA01]|uniref:hypothetical protein n=1 Tax=Acinetobacter sp. SA01 TaxID=1862567 RepID=UPI00140B996F|nr:hypothetical protein [Acinetobacter sp. SA01]